MKNKVFIASDHAGYKLKQEILKLSNENIHDLGTNSDESVDYPDFAKLLSDNIKSQIGSFGILICGTGIGMTIAANRNYHIRAGLTSDPEIASLMRQHNDANVLVLPGRFINIQNALNCVNKFLSTSYQSGRHQKRIEKLNK